MKILINFHILKLKSSLQILYIILELLEIFG